ncbi:methyltransferase domain-containing protein [Caenimonas sedimenti]|uniref:Methyltransferase domain-containing protein n=1 Tax=Caenimonas sedimenti TaxID=2596921 RepID=A0A562ZVT9_9BURK|nr:methyltransferase domain-containing protein [Caenimonas sedimenti]TWO72497.1 methyltransferase domain-containing protein [Caenimonas sedimenti]
MTEPHGSHVYRRQITPDERTSLSVLAGHVTPGSRVLDLGTGSGSLGAFLSAGKGCTCDGVTLSAEEAELAKSGYRHLEVANLEQSGWAAKFAGEHYDFIVCADVLEHLTRPEQTLALARELLAPGGALLVSIPNASYCGMVAELMQGGFQYGEEGLLDRTHLRFFTRRSARDFLADNGWAVEGIETIEKPLQDSEFRVQFDNLPPAVSRYLLALPDAAAYQLILVARPGDAQVQADLAPSAPAEAMFSAQLYWAADAGYSEETKLTTAGVIGRDRQVLRFPLPGTARRLRLDPADRPGFLHLFALRLRSGGETVWAWTCQEQGLAALETAPRQQMLLRSPLALGGALILLHGDDPWIELPIPQDVVARAAGNDGVLEVELGWPMSADYLALADSVRPLADEVARRQGEVAQAFSTLDAARAAFEARQHDLEAQVRSGGEQVAATQAELRAAQDELRAAHGDLGDARARLQDAERLGQALLAQVQEAEHARLAQEEELRQRTAREQTLQAALNDTRLEARRLTQQKFGTQRELQDLQQRFDQLAQHLRWIEQSTVFRATRPLVHAKMAVDRWLGRGAPAAPAVAEPPKVPEPIARTVDVIVPVYRGLEDTRCCIESVLASRCETPVRLVVLNDASPEPEVTAWLREAADRDSRITLLENEQNLGFVGTVNRGMALNDTNDVVLLNSDAEVANDWLDRLRRAAYADSRVGTVTPFSNNATICSYPRFCEANPLPEGWDTARLDRVFAEANAGEAVDIPTGVGFCMYIRRDCLREVGLFDVEEFGKGYGEENDFCCRADEAGWRNLHALDTFVRHAGGVSFGESKSQRELDAMDKLRRLHPTYETRVHQYLAVDPAREARMRADLGRVAASGLPCVLAIQHNRGGGTKRHVEELAAHLRGQAVFFSLSPAPGECVRLELLEPGSGFHLEYKVPDQWEALLAVLRSVGVAHVHYHHLIGHHDLVFSLAQQLGVSSDFTTHDYFPMCANISLTGRDDRFCGEQGRGECGRCLSTPTAANLNEMAAWRQRYGQLLLQTRAVLAPSHDVAARFLRMWPGIPAKVAPHTDIAPGETLPAPQVTPVAAAAPIRIAVLGGLSRIKGADVLEDVAVLAAREGAKLEFHLVGHAYRNLKTLPQAALIVHGKYQEQDLPALLAGLRPDLVWFPALWPETYSYTLSACLQAGLPIVAPDLGAFGERLEGRPWSWVEPWDRPAADWLAFFQRIRVDHFLTGRSPDAPEQPVPAEPRAGAWTHSEDYTRGFQAQAGGELPDDILLQGRPGDAHALASGKGVKRLALASLVRLRSATGLRQVARAIPARWQRRVKNWLVA